jgi:hypothetical protein
VLEKCRLMFRHEYEETRFPGDDRTAGVYELNTGDQEGLAAEY